MTLTYRTATPDDIAAMTIIRNSVTENRLSDPSRVSQADYLDSLARLGQSWVCEANGAITGFSSADKVDGSIWALFIDRAHEGKGSGQALLALAVDYLFAHGHERVVLSTGADTRADRFYAAQGWLRSPIAASTNVSYTLPRPA